MISWCPTLREVVVVVFVVPRNLVHQPPHQAQGEWGSGWVEEQEENTHPQQPPNSQLCTCLLGQLRGRVGARYADECRSNVIHDV